MILYGTKDYLSKFVFLEFLLSSCVKTILLDQYLESFKNMLSWSYFYISPNVAYGGKENVNTLFNETTN